MAFSFSPGQISPQASQVITAPGTVAPGTPGVPATGSPSVSPFLFIKDRSEGRPLSIMACVQIVLMVVAILSVIITGVLYAYTIYLKNRIESSQQELISLDAKLPDYPYDKMTRLSKRVSVLDKLLQEYISPRSPLKFLENVVENNVVFGDFKLNKDKTSGAYTVSFTALTSNYVALVQQLQALNLTEYSKVAPSPKVGGITETPKEVRIGITTPVFVQGKLPDDVVFFVETPKTATSTNSPSNTAKATSTTP